MTNPPATSSLRPFHRAATVETSLAYMGSIVSFLANAAETEGGLAMVAAHARLGNEPPPHVHHREHEMYYVLDGAIEFFVEGEEGSFLARSGEAAFLPQGKAHALYFRAPEVRALIIAHASGDAGVGLDAYLRQMAVGPATSMKLPDQAATYNTVDLNEAFEIAEANGVTLLSPGEAARRLPHFPGFGANLREGDLA